MPCLARLWMWLCYFAQPFSFSYLNMWPAFRQCYQTGQKRCNQAQGVQGVFQKDCSMLHSSSKKSWKIAFTFSCYICCQDLCVKCCWTCFIVFVYPSSEAALWCLPPRGLQMCLSVPQQFSNITRGTGHSRRQSKASHPPTCLCLCLLDSCAECLVNTCRSEQAEWEGSRATWTRGILAGIDGGECLNDVGAAGLKKFNYLKKTGVTWAN